MRRRDFIKGIVGSTAAWPLAAHAQQGERVRRIGVLQPAAADDAVFQARVGAFLQELALLGWAIGRNLRVDIRWATTNAAEIRKQAAELVALAPEVILAAGDSTLPPSIATLWRSPNRDELQCSFVTLSGRKRQNILA